MLQLQLTEERKREHLQTSVKIGEIRAEQHIGSKRGRPVPHRITERREERVDTEYSGAEYDLGTTFDDRFEHSDEVTSPVFMVGIEHDHVAPRGRGRAVQYRGTLAQVGIMAAEKDTRIINPLEQIGSPIRTAVVHHDQFESVAEFHLEDLGDGPFDGPLFVVGRHHHRQRVVLSLADWDLPTSKDLLRARHRITGPSARIRRNESASLRIGPFTSCIHWIELPTELAICCPSL